MSYDSTIITINDLNNYGNRLQNYALTKLLGKYGKTTTSYCVASRTVPVCLAVLYYPFSSFVRRCVKGIKNGDYTVLKERHKRMCSFTKRWVPAKSVYIDGFCGIMPKKKLSKNYVLGSDQVWNFAFLSKRGLGLRLGACVPEGHSIISYAASFGVSEVDDAAKPIFQKYLPRLRTISVREDRGVELVKEMTGMDATVVLDPTLMLTVDKWREITENFVADDDEYVLTYFLGRPSDEQERDIQAYAKAHGCRVRRILDFRDKETYVAGPQDFVELFSKAQYVFTDSYHACCFSILFHKQFTVFNRAGMTGKSNMNSRMETLFRLFNLNSVMMDSGLAPEIDYREVDCLLEQHRKESQEWLDNAMED